MSDTPDYWKGLAVANRKVADDALAESAALRAQVEELRLERDEARDFIERRGYRRCDIAACNCGLWHGGHANNRLTEISEALVDGGVETNGVTILQAVLNVLQRAQAAESRAEALTRERDDAQNDARVMHACWDAACNDIANLQARAEALQKDAERLERGLAAALVWVYHEGGLAPDERYVKWAKGVEDGCGDVQTYGEIIDAALAAREPGK